MSREKVVAVLGATGAVGAEMIGILEERRFPVARLVPLASARSAGKTVTFHGEAVRVRSYEPGVFRGVDLALFSAGKSVSRVAGPDAVRAGAVVVDNSSCFRMDPEVPLVVPEINPQAIRTGPGIIANPNCSTIIVALPVHALHRRFRLRRMIVATYQAASGIGRRGIEELRAATEGHLASREPEPSAFERPIPFNVLPKIGDVAADAFTEEELKMDRETRKIFGAPDLEIVATCVRVPTFRAHAAVVTAFFDEPVVIAEAAGLLSNAPGVRVVDDVQAGVYPTPRDAAGRDEVLVGRIRRVPFDERGIVFFCVGDQIRKGAALNAVQIAERL